MALNVYDWHVLYFHEGYLDYFSVEESYEMGIDIQLIGPEEITQTLYTVLPLFTTRFAACTGGIRVPKLIWNSLHGRFIIWTYVNRIYEHAFYVCAIWDTQVRLLKSYCGFNTGLYCSDVCGYQRSPQTLTEICRNMSICGGFRAIAARENYPGFILFSNNLKGIISEHISGIDTSSSTPDTLLKWMPLDLTNDTSTLVQVIAGCHQATSDWLNQYSS